ncbi:MAG: hypothetical protein WD825_17310 [Gemmatimonadaceae bacterium]
MRSRIAVFTTMALALACASAPAFAEAPPPTGTIARPEPLGFSLRAPLACPVVSLSLQSAARTIGVTSLRSMSAPVGWHAIAAADGTATASDGGSAADRMTKLLPFFLIGMAALAGERNTKRKADTRLNKYPVSAATKCWLGGLAVTSATGFAEPGTTALNLIAQGRFNETVDNLAGAAGDKLVEIERGIFLFANAGADLVVRADVGKDCFIVDDQTVAKTNGGATRSVAGKVRDVEAAGVWVEI